jgi:hypothetical protein
VPQKFNIFNTFNTFNTFAAIAAFAIFYPALAYLSSTPPGAACPIRLRKRRLDATTPLSLRTGPGTGCRVPLGRGVVALG